MMIAARNAFLMSGEKLSYDAEVEYLESTGTQYIDTGVRMRLGLVIDADFTPTGNSPGYPYAGIYGVLNSAGLSIASISCIVPGDSEINNLGNRYMDKSISVPRVVQSYKNRRVVYHQANDGLIVTVDGISINYGAYNSGQSAESAENIRVFGISLVSGDHMYAKAKIYTFAVSSSGVLVRDFIPVRVGRGSSAVGYLYDRANPTGGPLGNGLYPNAGTGAFMIGPDK